VIPQAVDSPKGDLPAVHQVPRVLLAHQGLPAVPLAHQDLSAVPRVLLAHQGLVVRRALPALPVARPDRQAHLAFLAGSMARLGALTAAGTPVAARSDVEEW
jgi:hypothetical protein